ncbi:MAG: hypothetical protein AMXMBFR64_23450 [Myxococcales bacterium]
MSDGFVVWVTGLPASGKSTVARALVRALAAAGGDAIVLESDALRRIYTPFPDFSDQERERFYATVARLAVWLCRSGVPVVIDATGARRAWRDAVRAQVARFAEVWVDTPPGECAARDPKGLYAAAEQGRAPALPGVGVPYEPPLCPDAVVRGGDPDVAASQVVTMLRDRGVLP